MRSFARFILVLLVLGVLVGGGYLITRDDEQPPAPVMVHRDLTPQAAPSVSLPQGHSGLPELPAIKGRG